MLNQIILVGRIVNDVEVKKTENGDDYSNLTLAIPRSFKNQDGEYETDFVNCKLWKMTATNTAEYCKKGDIIGVKGRIETGSYEKEGEKNYYSDIVAERVTFLSSRSKEAEAEMDKDIEPEMEY